MNEIAKIETQEVDGPDGSVWIIMINLDIDDPSTADSFFADVVETFKMQRMISPPITSMLLVSAIGDLPADQIAEFWKKHCSQDEIAQAFVNMLDVADAIQGSEQGEVLSQASLLEDDEAELQ